MTALSRRHLGRLMSVLVVLTWSMYLEGMQLNSTVQYIWMLDEDTEHCRCACDVHSSCTYLCSESRNERFRSSVMSALGRECTINLPSNFLHYSLNHIAHVASYRDISRFWGLWNASEHIDARHFQGDYVPVAVPALPAIKSASHQTQRAVAVHTHRSIRASNLSVRQPLCSIKSYPCNAWWLPACKILFGG
jgi:hypothetical protein